MTIYDLGQGRLTATRSSSSPAHLLGDLEPCGIMRQIDAITVQSMSGTIPKGTGATRIQHAPQPRHHDSRQNLISNVTATNI